MHRETASFVHNAFKTGSRSAEEIVRHFLNRIKVIDPEVDALLLTLEERAIEKAKELDQKRIKGARLGKLAGVPIILKDNIHMKGIPTTCASKFLQNYIAPFDATVTKSIEEEDGIILGKSNLDEFAMGSSTEHSAFKQTKNPWHLACSPGGSSGGSAAAVAAMMAPLALGTDTGGSIRQPAAFCGISGFKGTYGRVSRFGLVAFGSSLDQIGPFAYDVEDIALMQEVIARPCREDSNAIQDPSEPYLDELKPSISGKKIGVCYSLLEGLDEEVLAAFENAIHIYKSLGCQIVPIELKLIKYSIPMYYILATAEASTNLARFDGIRYGHRSKKAETLEDVYELSKAEGYGPEVKQRILLGTYVLSAGYQDAYYRQAQKVRTLLIEEHEEAFKQCDVLLMPTTPTTTFPLGSIQDPVKMYMQDIYTISANLAGIPSLSIPIGFDKGHKPIGMQIQGPQLSDARVLRFGYHFQKETSFHKERPAKFVKEVIA